MRCYLPGAVFVLTTLSILSPPLAAEMPLSATMKNANKTGEPIKGDVFREAGRVADFGALPVVGGMPVIDAQTSIYGEQLDASGGDVWAVVEQTPEDYGESVLAQWIKDTRDGARSAGVRSLTRTQKRALSVYFDSELLRDIEYRFDPGMSLGILANDIRYGDQDAVVLEDTIVFRYRLDSEHNYLLWAHAIGHVLQFRELGIDGYAKRHLREYPAMVEQANATMEAYKQALQDADKSKLLLESKVPEEPNFVNQCRLYDLNLLVAKSGDVYPHGLARTPGIFEQCVVDLVGDFSRYCMRADGAIVVPRDSQWHQVGSCQGLP